jgi:DNA-binding response OmpR family regulator
VNRQSFNCSGRYLLQENYRAIIYPFYLQACYHLRMAKQGERILIVESDPMTSDLIANQALGGQGHEIKVVGEANAAIQAALSFSPDVVIANLDLPGLSGKDLMVALASQNIQIPVIMIASQGQEKDVIRAFRLGATDYIGAPIREAEVVAAVERALKTVRAKKERERLSRQLQRTNQELEKRVDELTTLFGVGKAVISVTDQAKLFNEIIKGAVKITQADYGWLLIRDERTKEYILRSQLNLPPSLVAHLGKAWDDGLSSLVARSGESLSIFGDPIERFSLSKLGKAALVVPAKVGNQVLALLVVMRKPAQEFTPSDQAMLEAVSDYAAISLVNAQLFKALGDNP